MFMWGLWVVREAGHVGLFSTVGFIGAVGVGSPYWVCTIYIYAINRLSVDKVQHL